MVNLNNENLSLKNLSIARPALDYTRLVPELEQAALAAGRIIMGYYADGFSVTHKSDASPVTEADQAAETIILEVLRRVTPDIAIVAEEEAAAGRTPDDIDGRFYLVDPLDGTKEFVQRNGDFTVNIALIEDGVPVVGVVYAPVRGLMFTGVLEAAQELAIGPDGAIESRRPIQARLCPPRAIAVASRSHHTPETEDYLVKFDVEECVSVGSSLKFCLLARGDADLYPRFSRTMEWDTAAGDAVLRAAGGSTCTVDGKPLRYGKRNQIEDCDFANPHFIARGGRSD